MGDQSLDQRGQVAQGGDTMTPTGNAAAGGGAECNNLLGCAEQLLKSLDSLRKELSTLQNTSNKDLQKLVQQMGNQIQNIDRISSSMQDLHFYRERTEVRVNRVWQMFKTFSLLSVVVGYVIVVLPLILPLILVMIFKELRTFTTFITFCLSWVLIVAIEVLGLGYILRIFSRMMDPKEY